MTGDEVERAIETLLNNQDNFEVQLEKTNQQLGQTNQQVEQVSRQLEQVSWQVEQTNRQVEQASRQIEETNKRLENFAATQTQFIQIVTRQIEAQGEINASFRASLARTDERLDALIDIVREGLDGKS
jgi:chromosome segregation ATPase